MFDLYEMISRLQNTRGSYCSRSLAGLLIGATKLFLLYFSPHGKHEKHLRKIIASTKPSKEPPFLPSKYIWLCYYLCPSVLLHRLITRKSWDHGFPKLTNCHDRHFDSIELSNEKRRDCSIRRKYSIRSIKSNQRLVNTLH